MCSCPNVWSNSYTWVQHQSLPSIFSSDIGGRELMRWPFKTRFWAEEMVQLVVLAWETQDWAQYPAPRDLGRKERKEWGNTRACRFWKLLRGWKGIKVKPRTNCPKHPTPGVTGLARKQKTTLKHSPRWICQLNHMLVQCWRSMKVKQTSLYLIMTQKETILVCVAN